MKGCNWGGSEGGEGGLGEDGPPTGHSLFQRDLVSVYEVLEYSQQYTVVKDYTL